MRNKSLLCIVAGYFLFFAIEEQTYGQKMIRNVNGVPKVVGNENNSVEAAARFHNAITVFMCGDVMTGRGIDQVLPHPSHPGIHESYVTSALGYVELAEAVNGPIAKPVSFSYIWGDALDELNRVGPNVRIINLETSVTKSEEWIPKVRTFRHWSTNCARMTRWSSGWA